MLPNSSLHHLLFIDDDEEDFMILTEALKEIESDVDVTYIQNCSSLNEVSTKHFDIIFLDINMPKVNGIQCLRQLKESALKNVPVVMYSTTKNPVCVEEAYKSGANLFFRKPISFGALTSALKTILQLNWNRPQQITNSYTEQGIYKIFDTA